MTDWRNVPSLEFKAGDSCEALGPSAPAFPAPAPSGAGLPRCGYRQAVKAGAQHPPPDPAPAPDTHGGPLCVSAPPSASTSVSPSTSTHTTSRWFYFPFRSALPFASWYASAPHKLSLPFPRGFEVGKSAVWSDAHLIGFLRRRGGVGTVDLRRKSTEDDFNRMSGDPAPR